MLAFIVPRDLLLPPCQDTHETSRVIAEKSMPNGSRIGTPEDSATVKSPQQNVHNTEKDGDNTCRPSVLATWLLTKGN